MSGGVDLERLLAALAEELPRAAELRRELHRRPELGHRENGTRQLLVAALEGVDSGPILGTGLLARAGGAGGSGGAGVADSAGAPAPILVRAELDGLPIEERTGADFAAGNGAMHACGHDVHMAALVALTRAVARLGAGAPPLLAFFQPSEEAPPSGARAFLAEAAAHGPLRAVVAAHVHPEIRFGAVAVPAGPINAACDDLRIEVTGAATHAAYPHRGRDPVLALAAVVTALQQVVARRLDPLHPAVVSITRLAAGEAANAIPNRASAWGTVRTLEPGDRAAALELVRQITADVARAHGCEATVEVSAGEPALVNDAALCAAAEPLLAAAGASAAPGFRSCGSDDIAFLGELAPLAMAFVGVAGAQELDDVPLHDPRFLPKQVAVAAVARAQACLYAAAASAAPKQTGQGSPAHFHQSVDSSGQGPRGH
ncbi:MAG: amidohydrolase [Actinobacteria bacterium]|nr:amidohydrolase [Actinomycetota bacterium]